MRIRMMVGLSGPHILLAPGDEAEFADVEAIRFIDAGFAVPVAPPVERAVKAAPEKRTKK
jgi:hypothetical protein